MTAKVSPVSRKFYESLVLRVDEIARTFPMKNADDFKAHTMQFIDCYLAGGDPDKDCEAQFHNFSRIVFISLKDELDRAKRRSKLARKRSLARKRLLARQKQSTQAQAAAETPANLPIPQTRPRTRFGLKFTKAQKSRGRHAIRPPFTSRSHSVPFRQQDRVSRAQNCP